MTKEELIEKMNNRVVVEGTQKVLDKLIELEFLNYTGIELSNKLSSFVSNFHVYEPELAYDFHHISDGAETYDVGEREFLSWFKEEKQAIKKKRSSKLNKREKLEARLSQVEETTKKAFTCICDKEGYELGVFRSGKYTVPLGDMNPEQAVQFAKWVLDLEGK